MPNIVGFKLNRALIQRVSTVDFLSSNNVVQIKADPSQQINIWGVHYGYTFVANIDRLAFEQSYVIGYLDFTLDPNTFTFSFPEQPEAQRGEVIFIDSLGNELETFRSVDISNPLVITGDRVVTFILPPADLSGVPTADIFFILLVRGEVTQIEEQDKPRLGNWIPR